MSEHSATELSQHSIWAARSPLRNSIICEKGILATTFTAFAVLCAITFISLLIRPTYYLSVCANSVLGWLRLRRHVRRHPKLSVISCQTAALVLSSSWWTVSIWSNSLAGAAATTVLWIVVLGILVFAIPGLGSVGLSYEQIFARTKRKWPERWFAPRMRNPLDAYFAREAILSSMVIVPAWIVLFQDSGLYPMNCMFFAISFLGNAYRHERLDHTNMHNRLFRYNKSANNFDRRIFSLTNMYLAYVLNPLCLRIPSFYHVQHLYVHHVENNGLDDVQSTVLFDRRSFIDFCKCSLLFALDFSIAALTISYLIKKAKFHPLRIVVRGLILWYGAMAGLWLLDPTATAFILCYKFAADFVSTFNAAFGWHGFADPEHPENIFRNTINIVPNDSVDRYFGNNSHIEHHLHPGRHWSKVAEFSSKNSEEYDAHGALQWHLGSDEEFNGVRIMKAVWLGRLDVLMPLFAGWSKPVTYAEAVELVHARTRPVFGVARSPTYVRVDRKLGAIVARYLLLGRLPRKKKRGGAVGGVVSDQQIKAS